MTARDTASASASASAPLGRAGRASRARRALVRRLPRHLSRTQVLVRAVGALVLVATAAALGTPTVLLLITVLGAACAAIAPESAAWPATAAVVVLAWALGGHDPASPGALALALALLTEHTSLVIASAGPARAVVPGRVIRRAAARALVIAAITALTWALLALAPAGTRAPGWAVLAALAVLGAGVLALTGTRPGRAQQGRRRRRPPYDPDHQPARHHHPRSAP
ncbi:hypothetical protein [Actinomyces radicidentis]|uniref:hypothetical protein n=1 Tax=Actinomyces radicidentis TaxID=111015 RepID=UPI0026DF4B9A|nr:hypothetical protein [Actinomyces radicidentis]